MAFQLGLALLVRLVLMPISAHNDLLFANYFPYFLGYHGVWDIYGSVGRHYLESAGFTYYAPLVYYLVAFWQACLKPLAPGFAPLMERIHAIGYRQEAVHLWEGFPRADAMRLVATMKFPYLLTDVFCLFLIAEIGRARNAAKILSLWVWHPVLLFSVYVFGTYRIYTAFLVWLAIVLVQKGRRAAACMTLGFLCLADNFPWLLLGPSILVLGNNWKERALFLFAALASFAMIFIPLYAASDGYVVYAYASPLFAKAALQSLTRHYAGIVTITAKAVFVIIYAVLLSRLFAMKTDFGKEARMRLFICVNAAVLLLFYATSQTLAHYFMWVLPFFVFIQAGGEPWQPWLSWLAVFLLFVFNLDTRSLNLGLLSPLLGERAIAYPSLHEFMDRFFPWGRVVAASRLLFSALCFYFVWRLFDRRIRSQEAA